MPAVRVTGERSMTAPAPVVYGAIANYKEHHPNFLPDQFSDVRVEQGGIGAGTVISFRMRMGGMTKSFRHTIAEPVPGRMLTESDDRGVTTFTVTPAGAGSRVLIETAWQASGVQGFFERLIAPRILRKLYADELARLEQYTARLAVAPPKQ